jgi:asparagine synthase (glutamine-hydrolysing)
MKPRYLLVIPERDSGDLPLVDRLAKRAGLRRALVNRRMAAFANEGCRCLALGNSGCVLGTLFDNRAPRGALGRLEPADSDCIVKSSGDALLGGFWGGYVAAVASGDCMRVLRDPSAALQCYFSKGPGFLAFSSEAGLLAEYAAGADLDWGALAAHFYRSGVPAAQTCVRGIRELLPGFALRSANVETQEPCWSPWDHCSLKGHDTAALEEGLAQTVRRCVSSWASERGRLLVSVSGGLDSSIVAAALASCGADAHCLTLYGDDPAGDERPFARALCRHLGLPLIERAYSMDDIDIGSALGAHLPRPSDRTHAQSYEKAHLEVAGDLGAQTFVTGNGGDSLFNYSQSAAPAADRFLAEGIGRGIFDSLRDVSKQTGCSLFRAAASAARIACGSRSYRVRPDSMFLHPDAIGSLESEPVGHPWLNAPAGALPGKAAHIASILRVQQCLEPGRARDLQAINPLMAQPVIEFCLAVPSWEWRSEGRDRSLARRAFRDDLPAAVLRRRVKGGPDGFAAEVLDRFRSAIKERLLFGNLVRERIVDRASLELALAGIRPGAGEERARIFELLAAEAWIDSWRSRRSPGSAVLSA